MAQGNAAQSGQASADDVLRPDAGACVQTGT